MFPKRLKEFREKVSKSARQFAEDNAIDARTYNNYETGERSPGLGFLQQIALKYDVNLNWLMLGVGDINNDKNNSDSCPIPIRGNVNASCGYGIEVYDESQTAVFNVSKKFIKDMGVSLSSSEIIFARGDSMEDTIKDGDMLLIDTSKKDIFDGTLYAINLNGQPYAKRLQKIADNIIYIISDNSKYEKVKVDLKHNLNNFDIIGEIRWIGRIAK